ncbi:MAG: type I polyketide synthase [Spirulinaceae cyanobacterium]
MNNQQSARANYVKTRKASSQAAPVQGLPVQDSPAQDLNAIAIVGMGCRFPGGANSPQAFWELLKTGTDAITEVPADRWDVDAYYDPNLDSETAMNTRWGGFIDNIDQFDRLLFNISAAEAATMDPQQRLLLEVAWEAIESAGINPERVAGSKTGVFVGSWVYDYYKLLAGPPSRGGTGVASSMTANRLSHALDLRGPSLSIDTACSSSLVAVHTACQSLRVGDSDMALAGGVNLILAPDWTITLSQAGMMADDGRSKTFDSRANGYVRGEGCGLVMLKRLADAQADGDPILGIIRGSAVNQDGRTKAITAPNGEAQQSVIRDALERAQVAPEQIDYVEAHGTGTPLGDKTEVHSLVSVLRAGRSSEEQEREPCFFGSVKANIGHLEAAAGIAGLIKAILCLQQGQVPPQLHIKQLNPNIDLPEGQFAIATPERPYQRQAAPRFAGVNSFGYGGTNAHIILEAPHPVAPEPSQAQNAVVERPLHLLCLSAKKEKTLQELASLYQEQLSQDPDRALADLCYSANTGRSHLDARLAIVADSSEALLQKLQAFLAGEETEGLRSQTLKSKQKASPKVTFVFSGQGSRYIGIARELYETQPTFRATLDRCNALLQEHLQHSLLEVLTNDGSESAWFKDTLYREPMIFALEYALAQQWLSWGIEPEAVLGYGIGEYTAACISGVFDLETGLALAVKRGELLDQLQKSHAKAAVYAEAEFAPWQSVAQSPLAQSRSGRVGGLNSSQGGHPASVNGTALQSVASEAISSDRFPYDAAYQNHLMNIMLDGFESMMQQLTFAAPTLPFISGMTGHFFPVGEIPNARHWRQQLQGTLQFNSGIQAAAELGCNFFLEVGAQSVLTGLAKHCLPKEGTTWLTSLSRSTDNWQSLLSCLQVLYINGANVDWEGFDADYAHQRVSLPTYPFQRKRCWLDASQMKSAFSEGISEGISANIY